MADNFYYPRFYFYSGRRGSDRDWILRQMSFIPPEKQQEVSDEYERVFLSGAGNTKRDEANKYLLAQAMHYKNLQFS